MIFDNYGAHDAYAASQQNYGSTTGIIVDSNLTPRISKNINTFKEEELDEYALHSSLDSRLWDQDNHLLPEVREALLKIANLFNKSLKNILTLIDIRFTGSEANYNFNDASDIDLHLIFDFNELPIDSNFITDFLIAKKDIFNSKYNFTVHDVPVEVGAEDINTPLVSSGVYSVMNDSWLRTPENANLEITSFDQNHYDKIVSIIRKILQSQDLDRIKRLHKNLKGLRKLSLAIQGEFGEGNLIFKQLRADGILQQIKDVIINLTNQKYSVYKNNSNTSFMKLLNNELISDIENDNNTSIMGGTL